MTIPRPLKALLAGGAALAVLLAAAATSSGPANAATSSQANAATSSQANAPTSSPAHAATASPAVVPLPQYGPGVQAAAWLARQFTPQGYVPSSPGGPASLSFTAQTVLALSAVNYELVVAERGLSYLSAHVDQYVVNSGSDGPGQLAILILDARALGADPTRFGGTNLVARLLATQQRSGADAGLFGSESQIANYLAGTYDQGLALAALAAAGVTGTAQTRSAIAWLDGQQCPDGGWTSDQAQSPCNGDPSQYSGPDTNSSSVAIQGLAAQGGLTGTVASGALTFLGNAQDTDGGWSYYPSSQAEPQSTDPDSTALVIQAVVALKQSPTSARFLKSSGSPVTTLLGYQLKSGSSSGAFYFPGGPPTPSLLATFQAVPALAGLPFGWGHSGQGYWEGASDGGVFTYGRATFSGSSQNSGESSPFVGLAATPDGHGYWMATAAGDVTHLGDAQDFGDVGNVQLAAPVVAIAAAPSGRGYWLVASDGGIFAFGDAKYAGSLGGTPLDKPIVGIAPTPDGQGYWLAASDGGVFAFGDAGFAGSLGGHQLERPVVGIAPSSDGRGYWLAASDGGIFAFGDAGFAGSLGGHRLDKPVVGIAATPDGRGYWEVASDGGIFAFGNAGFHGSTGGIPLDAPVVGIAVSLAHTT